MILNTTHDETSETMWDFIRVFRERCDAGMNVEYIIYIFMYYFYYMFAWMDENALQ